MLSCEVIENYRITYGAKRFVKKEFVPRLHDAGSYELANMKILMWVTPTALNSILAELQEERNKTQTKLSNLRKKDSELRKKRTELVYEMHRSSDYVASIKRRQINRIEREENDLDKQVNSLRNSSIEYHSLINKINNWIEKTDDNEYVYALILHEFRARNRMGGYVKEHNQILYFPSEKKYIIDSCPVIAKYLELQELKR